MVERNDRKWIKSLRKQVGKRTLDFINSIDTTNMSDEERGLAHYYHYLVSVALLRKNREDYLPEDSLLKEIELGVLRRGAIFASKNYLQTSPENPLALKINKQGMSLPDKDHAKFFEQNHENFLDWIRVNYKYTNK